MASYLILLGLPRELNIPYFAMPVPASRENNVVRLDIASDLGKLVGRRGAAWVQSRLEAEVIELIETRNYIPPKTAFYATWLLFQHEAATVEFLDAWPRHRLDERLAKIKQERETLATKLQQRLERGDFDLGHIGDEQQRENLANIYIKTRDALRDLHNQLRVLETAKGLGPIWQEKFLAGQTFAKHLVQYDSEPVSLTFTRQGRSLIMNIRPPSDPHK